MPKKKILLQTNAPYLKTGLGEQGRYLFKYLYNTNKYDLVYYCTQVSQADPMLDVMPIKCYGAIPTDPNIIQRLNQDQAIARNVAYGSHFISEIMDKERPDIYWESDDLWSTGNDNYYSKSWFKCTNPVLYKTADSIPLLDSAFEQAKVCKNYYFWSCFAEQEIKKFGSQYSHVKTMHAMFDINHFSPISKQEKIEWRKKFRLNPDDLIFFFMSRNQLRKGFNFIIAAFAEFKKEFPFSKAKLYFHTSFSEMMNGFNILKMATYYGINANDILSTYVCKNCGQWHIRSYCGENIDCPYCGKEKSMISPTIANGVPDEDMKYIHGIADAGLSVYNSGGCERFSVSSLLCGLPTAVTSYSCGADFAGIPFITSLSYKQYFEAGTNFIKAATDINSIKSFMCKVYKMTEKEKQKISEQSRQWAVENYSSDIIGKKWEDLFDSLPPADWLSFSNQIELKNPDYPMPQNCSDLEFITLLYKNILKMDEPENGSGHLSWQKSLKDGKTREEIYQYFLGVARQENDRNTKIDFSSLIDQTDTKRLLLMIRESIGDSVILTSLLKPISEKYPNYQIYIGTQPQYFSIFEGVKYVHKVIPYIPQMESEIAMMGVGQKRGYFDVVLNPAVQTQRQLNYLSH